MSKKSYLYLDDCRYPIDSEWVVVKDYDEFVKYVEEQGLENIQRISLDHDLGKSAMNEYFTNTYSNGFINYDNIEEKTGMDVCKYLVKKSIETKIPLPLITVHSHNPIGRKNMKSYINSYLKYMELDQTCVDQFFQFILDKNYEDY